jgi:signal transduction histidine kinase
MTGVCGTWWVVLQVDRLENCMTANLDTQAILDALGHGVLIFSGDGDLIQHNMMAGAILGTDLNVIKSGGWSAAMELFDTDSGAMDFSLDSVRDDALQSERPIRFNIFRSGAYVPCWAAALHGDEGEVYTMLTLDVPDWEMVSSVIDRFQKEMRDAVDSTIGHINLIARTLEKSDDDDEKSAAAARVERRVGGFTRLINIHMHRARRLMTLLNRLQAIRTNTLRENIRKTRKKINVFGYMEDFIEELDEIQLLDPESETHDYRSRIQTDIDDDLAVNASPAYLTSALREMLRNAIMYSLIGTPITLRVHKKNQNVQFDIVDEGYGVRDKERTRVFEPFARARQPQIISEFGYGLALYLCKNEIEAMNGRLWFTTEESVGTTMSMWLPAWREASTDSTDDAADSDSSSDTSDS